MMKNWSYYNEIDPNAAQWLRNLIQAGHIAPGFVDERSIEDVQPDDLREFVQVHCFAGIGIWSHALRRAGWDDSRAVWTGSCPCQPFSAAGQGAGFDDERHLWPAFYHLIQQCRPAVVFGEQVASRDADPWIDLVQDDLEAMGYAFGAVPFPSAGVGAPHIRDRLYWVAHTNDARLEGRRTVRERADQCAARANGVAGGLGDTQCERARRDTGAGTGAQGGASLWAIGDDVGSSGAVGRLADTTGGQHVAGSARSDQRSMARGDGAVQAAPDQPGPTNGLWRDADWLGCRDGRWRPVEPGSQPLVDGAPSRVVRLRAYGNAINAEAARVFIDAVVKII